MRTTHLITSLALLSGFVHAQDGDDIETNQLPAPPESGWVMVGQAISDLNVQCCSIAFDGNNVPYVAFQDMSLPNGQASVMRHTGGQWQYVGPKGAASVGRAWYNALDFDANNNLVIATRDYGTSGRVNVRRYQPSLNAWDTLGPNGSSPDEAHWTDLVVGSDGLPYVVYADRSTSPIDRPTVMRFDYTSNAWVLIGNFGLAPTRGDYPSIEIDGNNIPYVAFSDYGHVDQYGNGRVSVMRYRPETSDWEHVGAPGFSALGGLNTQIAFDHQNTPYVVYYEWHVRLHVLKFDGTQWIELGTSASGSDQPTIDTEPWRQWVSLQFDSQNTPYIAYQMLYDYRRATVRKWNGTSWVSIGAPGFTPEAADYMSMAIDAYDQPWIAFRDRASGDRLSVMRYAEPVVTYCDATLNSQGCRATVTTTGEPNFYDPTAFTIEATNVINRGLGMMLYSTYPARVPFGANGFVCLQSPLRRAGTQYTGGNPTGTDCSGSLSMHFDPMKWSYHNPQLSLGTTLFVQYAYRDLASPGQSALTDAVRFVIGY